MPWQVILILIQAIGFGGRIEQDIWDYYNSEENNSPLINRAIYSTNAPGSTYKMVTAVAALQSRKCYNY